MQILRSLRRFRRTTGTASLAAIALLASGCYSTIRVNGLETLESWWNRSSADVRRSASFEIDCPQEELELTLLESEHMRNGYAVATKIGVRGCEHRLVYVCPPNATTWVLNSESTPAREQAASRR